MSTQIVFAIGYTDFEKKIVDELNTRTEPRKYLSVFSATHLDNILEKCIQLRPQILVIRDSMASPKQDFLGLIRQLRMSVTGLRIIVLTKSRQPGDPLMTGLMAFGIYDVLARESFSAADVANLILNPRKIQDMAPYVPKATLKNDSSMLSFSASDDVANASDEGNNLLNDINDDTPDQILQTESVNHTEKLSDIHEKEESTLYTESKPKGPTVLGPGMKLGYHPMFAAVAEPHDSGMPTTSANPSAPTIKTNQPLAHVNKPDVQAQTIANDEQTATAKASKQKQADTMDSVSKVQETNIDSLKKVQNTTEKIRSQNNVQAADQTINNSENSSVTKQRQKKTDEKPVFHKDKTNEDIDRPFFGNNNSNQSSSQATVEQIDNNIQKGNSDHMSQFDPKDAIKDRLKGLSSTSDNTPISAPPVHPKKIVNENQRKILEQQRAQAQATQTTTIPVRPKIASVGQPTFKQQPTEEVHDQQSSVHTEQPMVQQSTAQTHNEAIAQQKERSTVAHTESPKQSATTIQSHTQAPTTVGQVSKELNPVKKQEIVPDGMLSLFTDEELQQLKNMLKAVILRHSREILSVAIGDDSISDADKEAMDQLVNFSKLVNEALKH